MDKTSSETAERVKAAVDGWRDATAALLGEIRRLVDGGAVDHGRLASLKVDLERRRRECAAAWAAVPPRLLGRVAAQVAPEFGLFHG
jgi:hypothetical protein